MKAPYLRICNTLLLMAALVGLMGCAGGPRELGDRHVASEEAPIDYAAYENRRFSEYLKGVKKILKQHNGLDRSDEALLQISPFEISSEGYQHCETVQRTGVLLIHGLTDTPFLMRDIGLSLIKNNNCLLVRAIVLPGHATVPGDLLTVKYADWVKATNYGVASFSDAGVNHVFIAGYSTGGTLALNYAIKHSANTAVHNGVNLKGVLLFSPAIRIKQRGGFLTNWHYLVSWASPVRAWFDLSNDNDFAKYESFPKNAADQIYLLSTKEIDIKNKTLFPVPIFAALSQDDDTINSEVTRQFFNDRSDDKSRMIIYKVGALHQPCEYSKTNKVCERGSVYAARNIFSLSHTAIPVAPENPHYGEQGDYKSCYHYLDEKYQSQYNDCMSDDKKKFVWGEKSLSGLPVRRITFNPDFSYMAELMNAFVAANR